MLCGTTIAALATGPDLAFDEIEGFGPAARTQSVCHIDHALQAKEVFEKLLQNPGPVIIGAVQGASCFGPAYEFLFILETALRRAIDNGEFVLYFQPKVHIASGRINGAEVLIRWDRPGALPDCPAGWGRRPLRPPAFLRSDCPKEFP